MRSSSSEKERGEIWKDYMERIMDEEIDLYHNVEGETVDGPVVETVREFSCLGDKMSEGGWNEAAVNKMWLGVR